MFLFFFLKQLLMGNCVYGEASSAVLKARSPYKTYKSSLASGTVGIYLHSLIAFVRTHPNLVFLWHKGRNFRAITGDCRLTTLVVTFNIFSIRSSTWRKRTIISSFIYLFSLEVQFINISNQFTAFYPKTKNFG